MDGDSVVTPPRMLSMTSATSAIRIKLRLILIVEVALVNVILMRPPS